VPTQLVPRSAFVNEAFGSPVSGTAINSFDYFQWDYNPAKFPWKLIDPVSGDLFPKNDFFAYYISGFDVNGNFNPDVADASLLYNTEAKGPKDAAYKFGVDPSTGFRQAGKKYNFIGFYALHVLWGASQGFPYKPFAVNNGPLFLAYAYTWTKDIRFARAALILLDRIADVYPGLDFNYWAKQGSYHQYTGSYGKDMDDIWSTISAAKVARAYAMVKEAIDKDPVFLAFVKKQAAQYKLASKKENAAAVKAHIDKNFYQNGFDAMRFRYLFGNAGFSEETALRFSLAAADQALSKKIMDWLFLPFPGGYEPPYKPGVERPGGGLLDIIVHGLTSDGFSREGGNGYMRILPQALMSMYEIITSGSIITDNPSYKPAFDLLRSKLIRYYHSAVDYQVIGKYCPNFGDGWNFGFPSKMVAAYPRELLRGFYTLQDRELGRKFLTQYELTDEKKLKEYLKSAEFMSVSEDPGVFAEKKAVDDVVQRLTALLSEKPVTEQSVLLSGRGFGILKDGKAEYRRALVMNFGDNTGHNHRDTLNLDLFAFGLSITPNTGYPTMSDRNQRYAWWRNTLSHWTVAFPDRFMSNEILSPVTVFSRSPLASVISADAVKTFPGLKRYDRTAAMIQVNDKQFYVVDFFRADGEQKAMYCFHSGIGEVSGDGIELKEQSAGTLAGKDVEYGAPGESGLQYVYDVKRAKAKGSASLLWKLKDFRKASPFGDTIRTRLSVFHPDFELAVGKGNLPQTQTDPMPFNQHAFAISDMKSPLFIALVECYEDGKKPVVSARELVRQSGSMYAGGLEIKLADGSIDIILCTGGPAEKAEFVGGYAIDGQFAAVRMDRNGKWKLHAAAASKVVFNKKTVSLTPAAYGQISEIDSKFTYSPEVKTASPAEIPSGLLQPHYLRIKGNETSGFSSFFEIKEIISGKMNTFTLKDTWLISDIINKNGTLSFSPLLKTGAEYEILYCYYRTGE